MAALRSTGGCRRPAGAELIRVPRTLRQSLAAASRAAAKAVPAPSAPEESRRSRPQHPSRRKPQALSPLQLNTRAQWSTRSSTWCSSVA
ncbi:MAG: hypothetical protein NZM65_07270 [Flavobacteriales bacterium]|nr:hypothetical protein [Flavobacteriales bacterium]MDW8410473.1 hypothetical protein [Flavobacteriales bacterium]